MKRHRFAAMVGELLMFITEQHWYGLIGDANRSKYEQNRYWKIGRDEQGNKIGDTKTNCDGYVIISPHQYEDAGGKYAIDILIHDGDGNIDKDELYQQAHEFWSSIGGNEMIPWDGNHFEGGP